MSMDTYRDSFQTGLALAAQHDALVDEPTEFELLGLTWVLQPKVFAPTNTSSTEFFSGSLPYPSGGSFLEIGSGAGVTAVWAALNGCDRVTASDISPSAVRNTEANIRRHGLEHRVTAVQSDLFDAIDPGARFDLIFWNSVVIKAPGHFRYTREVDYSIFDREYATNARYLDEAPRRLTERGRLLMGSNSLGDLVMLKSLAAERGLALDTVATMTSRAGTFTVDFSLFEVKPAG
jgi:release factor glutamine methyltransferase